MKSPVQETIRSSIKHPSRQRFMRALSATLAPALIITTLGACGSSSSSTSSSSPTSSKAGTASTTASTLAGTYSAKLTNAGPFNATYILTIAQSGSLIVTRNGMPTGGHGNVIRGNTLTTANRCNGEPGGGVGRYTVQLMGKDLEFTRITDRCKARSTVLAHTFTRTG